METAPKRAAHPLLHSAGTGIGGKRLVLLAAQKALCLSEGRSGGGGLAHLGGQPGNSHEPGGSGKAGGAAVTGQL